jgi:hypothetical protein
MCSADCGLQHRLLSDVSVVSVASKEKKMGGGKAGWLLCVAQNRSRSVAANEHQLSIVPAAGH